MSPCAPGSNETNTAQEVFLPTSTAGYSPAAALATETHLMGEEVGATLMHVKMHPSKR